MGITKVGVILLLAGSLCYAVEPVPLENPSFEEDAAAETPRAGDWQTDGSPPGWHHWIGSTAQAGNPVLTWERQGGRSGRRCVSLRSCPGPVCVIQTTQVEVMAFNQVNAGWAYAEGEGDRSLEYWREGHWRFFSRSCERIGRTPSETMPVVCERFKVVFKNKGKGSL